MFPRWLARHSGGCRWLFPMSFHQGFLTAIGRDLLGGDAQFPTGLRVLVALRRLLDDPQASVPRVCALIDSEPLMVARLLRLANCATFNPQGQELLRTDQAVQRLGFDFVRMAVTVVAMGQMRGLAGLRRVPAMAACADAAWLRSVQLSVLARLWAAQSGDPARADEAGLCALVSELGTFYLLQRASQEPRYSQAQTTALLDDLLHQHGRAMTARLAALLELPAPVVAVLQAWPADTQTQWPDLPRDAQAHALSVVLQKAQQWWLPVFGAAALPETVTPQEQETLRLARIHVQELLSAVALS